MFTRTQAHTAAPKRTICLQNIYIFPNERYHGQDKLTWLALSSQRMGNFSLRCVKSALNYQNCQERIGCFGYADKSKHVHKGFYRGNSPNMTHLQGETRHNFSCEPNTGNSVGLISGTKKGNSFLL